VTCFYTHTLQKTLFNFDRNILYINVRLDGDVERSPVDILKTCYRAV